jgi:hypothetical protein
MTIDYVKEQAARKREFEEAAFARNIKAKELEDAEVLAKAEVIENATTEYATSKAVRAALLKSAHDEPDAAAQQREAAAPAPKPEPPRVPKPLSPWDREMAERRARQEAIETRKKEAAKPPEEPSPDALKMDPANPTSGPKVSGNGGSETELLDGLLKGEVEKQRLIAELADVFRNDRSGMQYDSQKVEVARALGITRGDVHRAVKDIADKEKAKSQLAPAQKVVALALDKNYHAWTDGHLGYLSVLVDGHWENYPIDSSECDDILRNEYSRRHFTEIEGVRVPQPISATAMTEAKAVIRSIARNAPDPVTPALRVGGKDGEIWIDLCRKDWTLVRVTAEGWSLFNKGLPNVAFIRKQGMLELPIPERGGDIRDLRRFVNVKKDGFILSVGWSIGAFWPNGPYASVMVCGEAGAAKTTTCLTMLRITDPHFSDLTPLPKNIDDLYVAAYNRRVLGFDNISYITVEQSDALCRLATGGGYTRRQLYTNADLFMMKACCPILLNGIPPDLADKSDIADRSMVLELVFLEDDEWRGDNEFWADFKAMQPKLFGALLDGLVGALAGSSGIDLSGLGRIRMIDFAKAAEAGCRRLGFAEGEFLHAFVHNQRRAMRIAFANDVVAQAIDQLLKKYPQGWRGNTTKLFAKLNTTTDTAVLQDKRWPKSAAWFGRNLRRSATVLRRVCGISIQFDVDLRQSGDGDKDGIEIIRNPIPQFGSEVGE